MRFGGSKNPKINCPKWLILVIFSRGGGKWGAEPPTGGLMPPCPHTATGTEGYLEYTKEKEKGKVNQLDVGNKKDQQNSGSKNPRTSKNSKNKTK